MYYSELIFVHREPMIIVDVVWIVIHLEIKNSTNYCYHLEDYCIVFEYLPTSVADFMVAN